jgi:tRNA(fMet)-specific endonuclease VapC
MYVRRSLTVAVQNRPPESGLVIGPMDLLIAGTAVSRGAVLVTRNTKEFSRVKGLRLADWTE